MLPLAGSKTWIALIEDINTPLPTYQPVITVAFLKRLE